MGAQGNGTGPPDSVLWGVRVVSDPIRLDLPFPPSVNNLFSQSRTGRRFPSKQYVAWRGVAAWEILRQAPHRVTKALTFPVHVHIALTPVDKRSRDCDNFLKPLLDSLVRAGVLPDDSGRYVSGVTTTWLPPDKAASRATITITNASGRGAGALEPELSRPA